MLTCQIITNTNFQIEAFADNIDHAIKHIQANIEFWVGLRQFANRWRDMVATKTEGTANVQRPHGLVPSLGYLTDKIV
ncbi:hypothetical protein D3C76_1728300 [compost metagenome]